MLATSRLYSFLDHKNGFNIHFLEGQKIIHDLALLHPMPASGFAYFRDFFLGLLPIIFFLKPQESLGIYLDSDDPYFRLKIETNSSGHTRTLLLPEEFNLFPIQITGSVRVTKIFSNSSHPYTSVIQLKKTETKDVINRILTESYQTNSEVLVGDLSDQSIMITKLPPMNINSNLDETLSRKEYLIKNSLFFNEVFNSAFNDIEQIVKFFEDKNFTYLTSRQVDLFCPCSKERMILNLRGLYASDTEDFFQGEDSVEIKCDYCKKTYQITKSDFFSSKGIDNF